MSQRNNINQRRFREEFPEAWEAYVQMVLADADNDDEYLITPDGRVAFVHLPEMLPCIFKDGSWRGADWEEVDPEPPPGE